MTPIAPLFYKNYDLIDFFYCTTVLLQLWFCRFYLTFLTPLFYWNYYLSDFCSVAALFYLADFFYDTTVLLRLSFSFFLQLHHGFVGTMIWFISSIAALFYCNYHLVPFFYCTTVFLRLKFGWFYLTFITTLFYSNYDSANLLLHRCFITIMIRLIFSIAPLFYYNYDLADFFYCNTVLLQFRFGWFLLL